MTETDFPEKRDIIFLNRAYNDMDIQMSLVAAFAGDGRFNVRVIGYPCDGGMGEPQMHEAAPYMQQVLGVQFETVLDQAPAPFFLRMIHKAERFFSGLRRGWGGAVFKYPHVALLMLLRRLLSGDLPWLDRLTRDWDPLFIFTDEALCQSGRSFMLDKIVRDKAADGTPVYIVQTGHNVYLDPFPNKNADAAKIVYNKSPAQRFFVPAALDRKICGGAYPDENYEICGNLRFDRDWLALLHEKIYALPYLDKGAFLKKLPQGGPKVVFMLSKLGYGIRVEEMKETLKAVAAIPGVACAIKPHTRGMKFDFMDPSELSNCAIVPDVPSSVLIEWADIVLFTGSSIAFHAMLLGKRVGFLQYCQYLETIFDDGAACDRFDDLASLTSFLMQWRNTGQASVFSCPEKLQEWQDRYIFGGAGADGRTADHYKKIILSDIEQLMKREAA